MRSTAIARASPPGPAVILSDGDVVFQPRKVERSGLWAAVDGHVLIYIHKEQMLDDVERRYPATHYVMVDDKVRILAAMKAVWRERLTTVFVRQGHYAADRSPRRVVSAAGRHDRSHRGPRNASGSLNVAHGSGATCFSMARRRGIPAQ